MIVKTLLTFISSSSRLLLLTWLGLVPDLDQLLLPPAADLGDVQHALHHPRHQRALQLAPAARVARVLAVRVRSAHLVWLSACGPGSVTRDTLVRGMVTWDTCGACEVFTASSRFCTACNNNNFNRGVRC